MTEVGFLEGDEKRRAGRGPRDPLAGALEACGFGLILLDRAGRVLYANRVVCDLLGCRERDLAGRPIEKFIQREGRRSVIRDVQRLLSGEIRQVRQEVRLVDGHGKKVLRELHARSADDGSDSLVAAVLVLEDTIDSARREPDVRDLTGQALMSVGTPDGNTAISLADVLATVDNLRVASPRVVARELHTRERTLRAAWSVAVGEGLVQRCRYANRDCEYRLTDAGRDRLAKLQLSPPETALRSVALGR
jgi:PAS domain S-box-containing protein